MSGIERNYNYINSVPVSFKGKEQAGLDIVTKPIDKVENIVNNTVDTFVPEPKTEEKKKSHKTAIRVGSTILVLSAFVALLNPKFSSSLVNKLKTKSTKAANKAKVNNSLSGKWNKANEKILKGLTNIIQILNNGNSVKDELFQKLCNKSSITKKIHNGITKGFDKISRKTVFSKYKNVSKHINTLDDVLRYYKDRLNPSEKALFDTKLKDAEKISEFFNPAETAERLKHQESLMQNLEHDVSEKIIQAKNTIVGKITKKPATDNMKLKDTCSFWAEDSLMNERNRIEAEGEKVISSLVGDGKSQTGIYREMVDILSAHLSPEEKQALEESIKHTGKVMRTANKTECVEYFDKKRDLVLGSAPTDVLTAIASLIASGIAIGVADTKEDRISRIISGALPVFAGLGVSTALTAMLFSGGKGMVLGTGSGMILSTLGSSISHRLFPKKNSDLLTAKNIKTESEVKNA